jgi:pimeloyl-ACP methyl ester carboxylesterase
MRVLTWYPSPSKLGWLGLLMLLPVWRIDARAEESQQTTPPGNLVDIGGYRLRLHRLGEGSPAVILLYGGGGRAADFNLVQPAVAQFTRACVYDRAGDAWSESGPLPRTMRQNAYELHMLLQKAGVNGPYVLAGQSYGGLLAREYARQFPKEVAGLVLIDSMHEDALLGVNGITGRHLGLEPPPQSHTSFPGFERSSAISHSGSSTIVTPGTSETVECDRALMHRTHRSDSPSTLRTAGFQ